MLCSMFPILGFMWGDRLLPATDIATAVIIHARPARPAKRPTVRPATSAMERWRATRNHVCNAPVEKMHRQDIRRPALLHRRLQVESHSGHFSGHPAAVPLARSIGKLRNSCTRAFLAANAVVCDCRNNPCFTANSRQGPDPVQRRRAHRHPPESRQRFYWKFCANLAGAHRPGRKRRPVNRRTRVGEESSGGLVGVDGNEKLAGLGRSAGSSRKRACIDAERRARCRGGK